MKEHPDSRTAVAALRKATHGLLYMSESDEPFDVIHLDKPKDTFGAADARMVAGRPADCLVQEERLDEFFNELAQNHDWHGPSETEDVRRYRELWLFFRNRLADATVFRLGEVQVDIIIIGRAADGQWVGVETRAVET